MQKLEYRTRWVEAALESRASRGKVRLLLGARQTGKSRLVRHVAPSDAVWVDLQDRRERLRFERTPGLLVAELEARKGRATVCVDEVQKVPGVLDDVQLLHDRYPGRFEFLVTGSSARRLRAGAASFLPGRSHLFKLFPLTLAERQGKPGSEALALESPKAEATSRRFPPPILDDLLVWGNLPGVVLESRERRSKTLEAYVEVYLEEEIRREALVRDVGAFARFLELAALESGRVMNLTGLSQESGVPLATLRGYYQILVDTFVGYWISPYGRPGRKQLLTTPRFLFFDPGVRNAAARLPLSRELLRTQSGELFEQWALSELVHRATYRGRSTRVEFWRTRHGAEVDAVVVTPREDLPIEVKWTENPRPTDARHLELFLDAYPKRASRGLVVCRCARRRKLTDRVIAIPWDEL